MEDSVKFPVPDDAPVSSSALGNVEAVSTPRSPPRKKIFKDPSEADARTSPLAEILIKSESVSVLGAAGQVLSTIPGKVERRYVYHSEVDDDTVNRIIEAVKSDTTNHPDFPVSQSFETVCPSCEQNPCFMFDYAVRMGEIAGAMKRNNKSNREIRYKLYRYLSSQIHGHLGHGNRRALPDCLLSIVRDAFPNEDNEPYVGFIDANNN